ncbi:unnamed protein product [Caenorhabditis auriculariae]|uniref:Uncharacterized protein n=1 Tax=Caenorhabditis auriculariae TaxID=2777116 RepID=A0A8S1HKM3_9PELO|nr:unnamed protein product [Caenorhabditis auriculariae]
MSTFTKILTLLALFSVASARTQKIIIQLDDEVAIKSKKYNEAETLAGIERDIKMLKEAGVSQESLDALEKLLLEINIIRRRYAALSDVEFSEKYGKKILDKYNEFVSGLPPNDAKLVMLLLLGKLQVLSKMDMKILIFLAFCAVASARIHTITLHFDEETHIGRKYNEAEADAEGEKNLKELKAAGLSQPSLDALIKLGRKNREKDSNLRHRFHSTMPLATTPRRLKAARALRKANLALSDEKFYEKFGEQLLNEFTSLLMTFPDKDYDIAVKFYEKKIKENSPKGSHLRRPRRDRKATATRPQRDRNPTATHRKATVKRPQRDFNATATRPQSGRKTTVERPRRVSNAPQRDSKVTATHRKRTATRP